MLSRTRPATFIPNHPQKTSSCNAGASTNTNNHKTKFESDRYSTMITLLMPTARGLRRHQCRAHTSVSNFQIPAFDRFHEPTCSIQIICFTIARHIVRNFPTATPMRFFITPLGLRHLVRRAERLSSHRLSRELERGGSNQTETTHRPREIA